MLACRVQVTGDLTFALVVELAGEGIPLRSERAGGTPLSPRGGKTGVSAGTDRSDPEETP